MDRSRYESRASRSLSLRTVIEGFPHFFSWMTQERPDYLSIHLDDEFSKAAIDKLLVSKYDLNQIAELVTQQIMLGLKELACRRITVEFHLA